VDTSDEDPDDIVLMPMVLRLERQDPPPRTALLEAAAAAALAVGGLGLPWLAHRDVVRGLDGGNGAAAALAQARSLDPLSVDPLLARWALAPDPRAGLPPLLEAVRMEPRLPDLHYLLGLQYLRAHDHARARAALARALALDPHDPTVLAAYRKAGG
jgi:hypothetical protein